MADQNQLTTYIALFHHRDHAAAAIRDLEGAGFTRGAVTVIGGGNGKSYSDSRDTFGGEYGYGDRSDLGTIGVPERDREHLQDGLNGGGTVLVLEGAGARAEEIEKIFAKHSTKKIDETDVDSTPVAAAAPMAGMAAKNVGETVIPIAQEDLVVGKREVDRGGVRVYKHVVETPVSEQVHLREERVVVDRQPVNRAVTDADLRTADQTIVLTETAEEAVVGKTARVVEEVRVGKEATDRTETIRETVRHTEVDVEEVDPTITDRTNTPRTNY